MNLGAHTFGFVFEADAEATFARLIDAGFLDLELMATPPHFNPWSSPSSTQRRLRGLLQYAGARLHALDLASSDVNLASFAPEAVDFAVRAYIALIDRAGEVGASAICVGSGRRHALLPDANARLMAPFRDAFERILSAARAAEIGVLLENQPAGLIPDAASIARFLDEGGYEDVGVIYDVDNASAIGEAPANGIANLAARIALAHLSDSPPGQWRHGPIGSGVVDFPAALAALRRHAPKASIFLEILSPTPLADASAGARRLRTGSPTLSVRTCSSCPAG